MQPVGSRPTTSVASGPFQPYGSTFDQLPDARVRNGNPFTLFALNKKSMPASGFEALWAQTQPNGSKQAVWEPWNQYMYRDEPIRLNLQVGQKAPKVLGQPRVAGFGPHGPKYGPNIAIQCEWTNWDQGLAARGSREEGGKGEEDLNALTRTTRVGGFLC